MVADREVAAQRVVEILLERVDSGVPPGADQPRFAQQRRIEFRLEVGAVEFDSVITGFPDELQRPERIVLVDAAQRVRLKCDRQLYHRYGFLLLVAVTT